MDIFVITIFWLQIALFVFRIINIITGSYNTVPSLNVYAADTVITIAIAIWAGFIIWGK